jgi:hypothetical protein
MTMKTIELTRGRVAIVDDVDHSRVAGSGWHAVGPLANGKWYAANESREYMHRILTRATPEQLVDHRNGDGLDNRRENLRVCTPGQNQANRQTVRSASGFKGVTFDRSRGRWAAKITVNYRVINLGRFATAEEAARAYDAARSRCSCSAPPASAKPPPPSSSPTRTSSTASGAPRTTTS